MKNRFSLTKLQLIISVIYAAAFPLSNLIGGSVQTFFIFATAPFLAIGFIVGGVFVGLFDSTRAYPFGLSFAIFIQMWLLLALWNQRSIQSNNKST